MYFFCVSFNASIYMYDWLKNIHIDTYFLFKEHENRSLKYYLGLLLFLRTSTSEGYYSIVVLRRKTDYKYLIKFTLSKYKYDLYYEDY